MKFLVTGAAGFVGFHVCHALLAAGHEVLGIDNINDYYDPAHKYARLEVLRSFDRFNFTKCELTDPTAVEQAWTSVDPETVIHLAAQAGVRYSVENPNAYIQSNIVGFQTVLELVRHRKPKNFVYASSSSVYGRHTKLPLSEDLDVTNPLSLYAATKVANEVVAKSYGNLYGISSTGLRFFTVYGPFGRPDMALFKFAEAMRQRHSMTVYDSGKMIRDFTYVSDTVSGVIAAALKPQVNKVYNFGRGEQVNLLDAIHLLEECLGLKALMEFAPRHVADVQATLADISRAKADLEYSPKVSFGEGVRMFADWYRSKYLV